MHRAIYEYPNDVPQGCRIEFGTARLGDRHESVRVRITCLFLVNTDLVCIPRLTEVDDNILRAYNAIVDLCPTLDELISWSVDTSESESSDLFELARFVSLS